MGNESKGGVEFLQIDEIYEYCAPQFFDFLNEESEEEIKKAENWFKVSQSYAPSPFMPKIKEGREIHIDRRCDFGCVENTLKVPNKQRDDSTAVAEKSRYGSDSIIAQQEMNGGNTSFELAAEAKPCESSIPLEERKSLLSVCNSSTSVPLDTTSKETASFAFPNLPSSDMAASPALNLPSTAVQSCTSKALASGPNSSNQRTSEACTPKPERVPHKGMIASNSAMNQTAKKIASLIKQTSAAKAKVYTPCVQSSKGAKPKSIIKCLGTATRKKNAISIDIALENQAIKRQKLDGGRSRQILNVKMRVLHHKSKPDLAGGGDLFASAFGGHRKDLPACKEQSPFISVAEIVNKFQSRTRDIDFSQIKSASHENVASMIQRRPKLKLTRPKEPQFETAQRVRAVRVKSSAELEVEMLAKIPKFKARPVNRKILEAPTFRSLLKSIPQPPEFKEFHLKTAERANQHAETSSGASSVNDSRNNNKPCRSTEPRPPHLETSLRARPLQIKSSEELELEELEKIPKFKARPLNKKILEGKGDIGLFTVPKPQITAPQEFHFATDERLGPPLPITEMFDKFSLHSESSSHNNRQEIPQVTIPNPFHLHTEERGLEKERQFTVQILQKQMQEENARMPKATPYPYTTDYPVVPPKPEPKQCTKPEAFQLESLIRHEEEMKRKMEERERVEREEAERRLFKAQPILREDPIPLPERERKPLTDVQEFVLNVDHRAVERLEFDKKMKEKVMLYKRLREENETAKVAEEEKVIKQMRKEMVPHARPLPKFDNPFLPQKSTKGLTKAKSPVLHVKQRHERRCRVFLR